MFLSGIESRVFGILYDDPKPTTAGGKPVTNCTLAVCAGYNQKKHTIYIECSFWDSDAESINKYKKGHPMVVEGIFKAVPYLDDNNEPAVRYKIIRVITWQSVLSIEETSTVDNKTTEDSSIQSQAQNPPKKQMTNEQKELYEALNYKFENGRYPGETINDILMKDAMYIRRIAEECKNKDICRKCCLAYNYYYELQQTNKSEKPVERKSNTIQGVKQNYIPKYPDNIPDGDLPF